MLESWRWYGSDDPVTLDHVRQTGATGVVTALHHLYDYRAWSLADVARHAEQLAARGLRWDVCESIPVPSRIKTHGAAATDEIAVWQESLRSVARAGTRIICFNFMPVLDWTRTDLRWRAPGGGLALRYDRAEMAAYEIFALGRDAARDEHPADVVTRAEAVWRGMDDAARERLEANIIAGLPGGEGRYTRDSLRREIARYEDVDADRLRANLIAFLGEVLPVAEAEGARLAIHPDDPPWPLFGLPRVVSSAADLRAIFAAEPSPANGMTFCTGSFGASATNDPTAMVDEFARRIHFVHLRNVQREADGSFYESDHLDGAADMVAVIRRLLAEEARRRETGDFPEDIPFRPDHGHLLIDDIEKARVNPGYSCIGRLKGLAELRGIIAALTHHETAETAVRTDIPTGGELV